MVNGGDMANIGDAIVMAVGVITILYFVAKFGGRFLIWVKMMSKHEGNNFLGWLKRWQEI
jgi:hypothetical protein